MESIVHHSRVAVVGLGQLGASLAWRLKQVGCPVVHAVARRQESIDEAVAAGMIDDGSVNAAEVLPDVDLTFLCLPLIPTVDFVKANLEHFRPGSVVTDVGSVKTCIVHDIRDLLFDAGVYFVGSHPMAGTEKSGLQAADAALYRDCVCFMTPTPDDDEEMLGIVAHFWREIGACVIELPADRHDAAVASASHLLHLVSAAAVRTVLDQGDVEAQEMAAAGAFRDMSRVAGGSPSMWTQISQCNTAAISASLQRFQNELTELCHLLQGNNWEQLEEYLTRAQTCREQWRKRKSDDSDGNDQLQGSQE